MGTRSEELLCPWATLLVGDGSKHLVGRVGEKTLFGEKPNTVSENVCIRVEAWLRLLSVKIKRSENTHGVRHCVTLSQVDLVAKQLSMPLLRQDTLEWELSQQYQNT